MGESETSGGLTIRPLVAEDIAWAGGLIGAAFGGRLQAKGWACSS